MLKDLYPVQWTGRQAVVALPEHIDVSNAGQIREELLSVINRGARALIADMTATISCDHAGVDAVVRAYQRAIVSGTDLRLVVTARIVSRMLTLSGLHRLVSIYPSLEAAAVAMAPAAVPATARTGTKGQALLRQAAPAKGQVQAAGPRHGNGAAITPAVAWKLLNALQDGTALGGGDDAVALASRQLAEIFAAEPPRLEDLAELARAAVTAGQAHLDRELLDTIITSLFHVGLSLHVAMGLPVEAARQRVSEAIGHLDDTIREIRASAFTVHDRAALSPIAHRSTRPAVELHR